MLRARMWLIAPCFVALLAPGCAHRESGGEPEPAPAREREESRVADELDQALARGIVASRALARNAHVRAFFADRGQPHKVLTVLRDVVSRADAEHATLLDGGGMVIASTDPESVGYEFRDRESLRSAPGGEVKVFPTVGFASTRRRLYFVAPQEGEGGGAAVLRFASAPLDRTLERMRDPAALIYLDRYAVATNRPDWGLHGVRPLAEREEPGDRDEAALHEALDAVVPPIPDVLEVDGTTYDVLRVPMLLKGWQLRICRPRS